MVELNNHNSSISRNSYYTNFCNICTFMLQMKGNTNVANHHLWTFITWIFDIIVIFFYNCLCTTNNYFHAFSKFYKLYITENISSFNKANNYLLTLQIHQHQINCTLNILFCSNEKLVVVLAILSQAYLNKVDKNV